MVTLKQLLYLTAIIWIVSCSSSGQIKDGNTAFVLKKYAVAAPLLEKEYAKASTPSQKSAIAKQLIDAYDYIQHPDKSLEWAKKIADLDADPEAQFIYGMALKKNEQYTEALTAFQKYLNLNKTERLKTNPQIDICNAALKEKNENKSIITTHNIQELNSNASDFSLVKINNDFYYTSARRPEGEGYFDDWNNDGYTDIFKTKSKSNQSFEMPAKLPEPINGDYHDAEPTFNSKGTEMIFTRCGTKSAQIDYCHLYFTQQDGNGNWLEPVLLNLFPDTVNVGQPFLTPDGKELYFSADASWGYGGKDIYVSKNNNGTWEEPVNLGPKVNTTYNELFPFLSKEGKLYFSSSQPNGYGGLDIYSAEKSGKLFSNIQRLPYYINSGGDDHSILFLEPNLKDSIIARGYLTSSRQGGQGKDDIYYFEQRIPKAIVIPPGIVLLKGLVQENIYENPDKPNSKIVGKQPLSGAQVKLEIIEKTQNALANEYKTKTDGIFNDRIEKGTNYRITVEKEGYFTLKHDFNTIETLVEDGDTTTISKVFTLNKIFKNVEIVINNIYYDYDKWDIRKDAEPVLDSLVTILQENPTLVVELGSHTDSRGTSTYNQELSQKRAESVVKYLVSKGIAAERLIAKGYGESVLLNNCADGINCTEEEHQQNRRTTFKILGD